MSDEMRIDRNREWRKKKYYKLLAVIPPTKPSVGDDLYDGYVRGYTSWNRSALIALFSKPTQSEVYPVISSPKLKIYEEIRCVFGAYIPIINWVVGGDDYYNGFTGKGGYEISTYDDVFPFHLFIIANTTFPYYNDRGDAWSSVPTDLTLYPPPVGKTPRTHGLFPTRPFAGLFVDRMNLILLYAELELGYDFLAGFHVHVHDDEEDDTNFYLTDEFNDVEYSMYTPYDYGSTGKPPALPYPMTIPLTKNKDEWQDFLAKLDGRFLTSHVEPIKEIVLPTGERADVDEAIDKLEAEMERYRFTHKGAPSSYPELAKLIGKYEEYGRLMLRQTVMPRENPQKKGMHPSQEQFIQAMVTEIDKPVVPFGRPRVLKYNETVVKDLENNMLRMLRRMFDAYETVGGVRRLIDDDEIEINIPPHNFERIRTFQPWTYSGEIIPPEHWSEWSVGGISLESFSHWPHDVFSLANISQPRTYNDLMPQYVEIFDLPFRGGNEDVVNYCPIYHDRLTRLFHYGYYTMKYPIFGMIAPLIVNTDDYNQKYRLALLNKATGTTLYIEDSLGDGIYPDRISFALYKDIKLVREQVNAMFQFKGNKIEPIKEIVLPTGERAEVDAAIDELEAEMERYRFTHKGAPSSYPELAKLIGKYEEYGRLMLRQTVMPRENPKKKK